MPPPFSAQLSALRSQPRDRQHQAVLGVNLVMGHAGQISLGQAGFAAIGAYATALLGVNLDVSYWLAVPLGALLAAVSGYILGLPALRLGPLYVSMVTFGFGL